MLLQVFIDLDSSGILISKAQQNKAKLWPPGASSLRFWLAPRTMGIQLWGILNTFF